MSFLSKGVPSFAWIAADASCSGSWYTETFGAPGFDSARKDDDELLERGPSDEEDRKRRRGLVKALVLDPIPNASGFQRYQFGIHVKVCAASKHDGKFTMRWIQQVEIACLAELEVEDKHWDELNVQLAQAVLAVAIGPLLKGILYYQETQAKHCKLMQGRTVLYHVYRKYV